MVIAIDFDGTLCEHAFPDIGQEVPGAFNVLKELQDIGHTLILWTMRSDGGRHGPVLTDAIAWCKARGIEFNSVNVNPGQVSWTASPKAYAAIYIDDAALGCPLRPAFKTERPMACWTKIRDLLVEKEALHPPVYLTK